MKIKALLRANISRTITYKKSLTFNTLLLLAPIFFLSDSLFAQSVNYCEQASIITKTAKKYHYNPREVDDTFSELLFPQFIEQLDPNGDFFTKSDISQLEALKHNIDNDILTQNCTFLEAATALYKKRLLFTDSLLTSFQSKKFNYTINDTLTIQRECEYLSQKQLVNKWEKVIKSQVLYSYYSNLDSSQTNKKPTAEELNSIKSKKIENAICRVKSRLNYFGGSQAFVGSQFLKTVSTTFDPHTNYFSVAEEQEFMGSLSKDINSFGINITRNEMSEIEISELIPGSSAWNSNALNEGDIILKVKALNIEKEFGCIAMDEVSAILNNEKISEAEFFIRKKSGKEISVVLNKSKVEVQENIIQSFVLEKNKKVGYIYLPSFYSQKDNGSYSYNGCATDVAKELIKLKNESINGLIVDLRNNGGGSMEEAILLAGIFIDYGAVSIVESRDVPATTLKDQNRGSITNAPIVILINQFSASASELFAAAMQDQNRAIIVGSTSYGKSTMQTILPIDAYKYEPSENYVGTPSGYLKVTIGAFYRATGKSHQKIGVIPDIKLPSLYDEIIIGEKTNKTALDPKTIDKKSYYYPLIAPPITQLNELSHSRVEKDSSFNYITIKSKTVAQEYNKYNIPLTIDGFGKYYFSNNGEDIPAKTSTYNVKNPSYFKNSSNLVTNDKNESTIADIKSDFYIEEAYNIINDLIKLNEKH